MKVHLYHSFLFLSITLLLVKSGSQLSAQPLTQRPAIVDASSYSDLQAAFDAVPVSGGLVMIPPGEYEIKKPLVWNLLEHGGVQSLQTPLHWSTNIQYL